MILNILCKKIYYFINLLFIIYYFKNILFYFYILCLCKGIPVFLVFSAARELPLAGAYAHVPFDTVLVDTAGGFDDSKTFYKARLGGFYLMHMSAGVPAFVRLRYTLQGTSSAANILLTHRSYDGEVVISRDDIQYIEDGQTFSMSSDDSLYSDGMKQTSWSGFKIDDIVSPLILFRAARTSSYSINNSPVPLDKMLINIGDSWEPCGKQFVVPQTGIYFLSFSSASVPNTQHQLELLLNGNMIARTLLSSETFDGNEISSRSLLLHLNSGDVAKLFLSDVSGPIYSDSSYQTSFIGFLYEPLHGQSVAWTLTFPDLTATYIYGPNYVNFTNILLNSGSAWNNSAGILQISTSGIYYLHISGASYPLTYKFNLIILLNGQALMNVMEKVDTVRKDYNIRSRSLIINLTIGDQLRVAVPEGYEAHSYRSDIMFSGFLISL